jgi:two-component system sensor histidine kinase HydH
MPYTSFPLAASKPLTIRKTLVIAFLLASLVPSTLLALLAFKFAGESLHDEIELTLQVKAATVSQDIDKMIFERLQNAQTWSRLEVMQDIRINDVDKRIAKFLAELKTGYRDVYSQLNCIDPAGRIVASSNAAALGRILIEKESMPLPATGGTDIRLEAIRPDVNGTGTILPIDVTIASMFNPGSIGTLQLQFDWSQIDRILDQAGTDRRMVMLIDRGGRVIAASSALRQRGFVTKSVPQSWQQPSQDGTFALDGKFLGMGQMTVGSYRSSGFEHFNGFGWRTLVIQPSSQAFVPIHRMAIVFLLMLALISALAVGYSLVIAGRIARPIASLTEFTRQFMRDKTRPPLPPIAAGEVGELMDAFVQTVENLELSRNQLVRMSKLAVLGEFSAVMAHEIRTPIGILRSSAQMLAREPALSDEGRELVGFVESETERLKGLVATLLDSARMRPPKLENADLHALVSHVASMLAAQAEKKSIGIVLELGATNPIICCDDEQMTQVLLNLILNALQVLPVGGHVMISCREQGEGMLVEIADDGPGIAASEHSKLFDPFYTRREGGVGLGLSVAQQIVAAHGGEITASASGLGGALFSIILPRFGEVA